MAVKATVRVIRASPQTRQVLLDLQATPPRKTIYAIGPLGWFIIGATGLAITQGAARAIFGKNDRNEAVEALRSAGLLAKLNKSEAETNRITAEIDRLRSTPITREDIAAKVEVIRANAPLDLALKEITLERDQIALDTERRLAPFVDELKTVRLEKERGLNREREERLALDLALADVAIEKELAAADVATARAAAQAQKTDLVDTALSGLSFFQKRIFLRDRLFPKPKEKDRRRITRFPETFRIL